MSWSDIFYPGNSKMKTRLAELSGQLYSLLENCFTAVNHLIDTVEEYLPGQKFEKIAMQKSSNLGDNCHLIIERVNEIKGYLENKEYEVEKLMGTELFNRLMHLDTNFQERIDMAKKSLQGMIGTGLSVGGVVLVAMIKAGKIFTKVVTRLGALATSTLAAVGLGVFGLAVDMIISAIIGSVEKAKLEEALKEYETVVEAFKPAADEFYDNISMITERKARKPPAERQPLANNVDNILEEFVTPCVDIYNESNKPMPKHPSPMTSDESCELHILCKSKLTDIEEKLRKTETEMKERERQLQDLN